ncbi:MAG: hypothetical protein QOI78_5832, partial [Actinomycetota bacterium]|nr:hypothetical protein [Actinomycetota bacterium]
MAADNAPDVGDAVSEWGAERAVAFGRVVNGRLPTT